MKKKAGILNCFSAGLHFTWCILLLAHFCNAQENATFFSLKSALEKSAEVKQLIIQGEDTSNFRMYLKAFKNLESLTLAGTYDSLPIEVCQLKTLHELTLAGVLKHPGNLGTLDNLKSLVLENASSMKESPFADKMFCQRLVYFNASGLEKDLVIPGIEKCTNLETLILDKTPFDHLPGEFSSLSMLKVLSLQIVDVGDKSAIPVKFKKLQSLSVDFSCEPGKMLRFFDLFSAENSLIELELKASGKAIALQSLPVNITLYKMLKKVALYNMRHLAGDSLVGRLSQLPILESLEMFNSLDSLPDNLNKCISLRSIDFTGKKFNSTTLAGLKNLHNIRIHCDDYDLSKLGLLPKLDTLYIYTTPPSFENLNKLKQLRLLYLPSSTPQNIRKKLHDQLPMTKIYYSISASITY